MLNLRQRIENPKSFFKFWDPFLNCFWVCWGVFDTVFDHFLNLLNFLVIVDIFFRSGGSRRGSLNWRIYLLRIHLIFFKWSWRSWSYVRVFRGLLCFSCFDQILNLLFSFKAVIEFGLPVWVKMFCLVETLYHKRHLMICGHVICCVFQTTFILF